MGRPWIRLKFVSVRLVIMWCVLLAAVCLAQGVVGLSQPMPEGGWPVIGGDISAPDTRPVAVIKPKPSIFAVKPSVGLANPFAVDPEPETEILAVDPPPPDMVGLADPFAVDPEEEVGEPLFGSDWVGLRTTLHPVDYWDKQIRSTPPYGHGYDDYWKQYDDDGARYAVDPVDPEPIYDAVDPEPVDPEPMIPVEQEACPERCECQYEGPKIVSLQCVGKPLVVEAPVEQEPCPERCECQYEGPKITSLQCVGKPLVVEAPVEAPPPPPDMVGLPEPAPVDPAPCPPRCTCETLPNGGQTMSCVGEPLSVEAEECPERCECQYEGPKIVSLQCVGKPLSQQAPPGRK